jgi:hypothetical protein
MRIPTDYRLKLPKRYENKDSEEFNLFGINATVINKFATDKSGFFAETVI